MEFLEPLAGCRADQRVYVDLPPWRIDSQRVYQVAVIDKLTGERLMTRSLDYRRKRDD